MLGRGVGHGGAEATPTTTRRSRRVVRRQHAVLKEGLANVVDARARPAPEIDNVANVELTPLVANAGATERMLDHRVAVVVALGPCVATNAVMRVTVQMAAELRTRVRPELAKGSFFEVRPSREAFRRPPRASGPGSDVCGVACGGHDRGKCPPQIYEEWCPRECAPRRDCSPSTT